MGWRTIIITGNAKLDYKMDYLVVRKISGTARVHLSEIEMLIVESTSVSVTTMLLSELMRFKIKVILCDKQHNPDSELVPYYGSHDVSAKVKMQINWSENAKQSTWTEIVSRKIEMQREHLIERDLLREGELLLNYIQEMRPGDESNREGHAAKVYFNALFGMDFSREANNSINAALNYGYGILLAHFNREIVSCGYLTQLGLFHDNMFNQFNLSSDLMEPFRILVDRQVYSMAPIQFGTEEKREIVELFSRQITIGGKRREIPAAIRVYCRSIFSVLNNDPDSEILFYEYEL